MSLDKLTQEGDDPAYSNRFFSGTLPAPTGKIANFLSQHSKEAQISSAGHLFNLLQDSSSDTLFPLNAHGNGAKPLTALVMFPDSTKVRMVYGPELGMAQIGGDSELDEKLLWLMNEVEDSGASPQALVLPVDYVILTKTMGRNTALFKAATKTQLEKQSVAHSDAENVEWEVMRLAPIPAYIALDAIAKPVEAAEILERLEDVEAPVGNPANMIAHLRKFLMTAFVKHNVKKSARLEHSDFMLGYNTEAAAWAKAKVAQMIPSPPAPAAPAAGIDTVLLQQLLLQQQGLVQQLQAPAPAATTTKEEKGWSETEVKRILTMCGKPHKSTLEDNIKELPAIFREVQKEKNKSLQLQLIKEKLDAKKNYKDSPTPNNPELFEVLRKRDFFAQDGASDPSTNAAFKHLSLFLCIRLTTEELEIVEEQREILERTEAKTSADIEKSIKKGVPVIPEAFHDFVEALRMFANTLWAYFGDKCPLFLRVQSLIEAIVGFEPSARKMFDHNQKAIILWLTFLEGRSFSKGMGDSVKAFDYMLNQLTWKIGRVTYAQMPSKLIRREAEEKKEDDNIRKLPPKATGSPPTSPDKKLRIANRPKCLKDFDKAVEQVKRAQNKEHIAISAICKACEVNIAELLEFRGCANFALYGKCTRKACNLPHKELSEAQAKNSLAKLQQFMADPVQVMGYASWTPPQEYGKANMVLADQGYPTKGKSKEVHVIVEDVEDEPACKKAKLSPSPIIQPRAQTPQSIDRAIEEAFQSDESFPDEITELQEEIGKYIGLMRPRGEALKHPAATMLEEFAIKGCPVNCGEDWTEKHIIEAIRRGAHPSAKKLAAIRELRKEAFDKVHGGYARIIKFGKIRHQLPKKLKISPIAAIPHKSRLFRFILDLSFQLLVDGERMPSVNSSTNKTAQQQSMSQLGQAIKRIINTMAQARKKDPAQRFHFAKLDIKDGFWRLAVSDEEAWNFCYVLPSENGEVDLDEVEIVVPNSLQMGWAESPPFFCSASETGRDVIEQLLTEESLPAHQMESLMFEEKFVYGVAAKDTINLVEVFVDDYIAITNDTSRANILHLSRAMLHGIHSVFPPTAITGHNGEDPIAQKKLLAGEGIWQEEKEILGWIIHGGKYTISLPPEKLQTLRNLVQKYKRAKKKKTDLNSWQKLAGKLMHASFGIVGGRSLMSPIWKAMEGSPAYINITEDLKQCLSDWKSIITSILKRPSDISLLVADTPDYNGYLDACRHGAGGILAYGSRDFPFIVWQVEWPEDIKQKLDTHEVTINDLELAAIVLEWFAAEAIIPNMYNIRLGMFCDNTSAVSWAQHGCTSTSAVAGQLLRLLYMRINTKEAGPALVTNVAGDDNTMADIASRAFRDDELLARTHYTKRVGVARDILSSWSYIGNGVTAKNEKERAKYWKAWCSYCCSICIDPFLRGESQLQATIAVAAFAARVRTGSYGLGEQVTVQTVTKAISAITKTIELAGERSPILTTEGQYTTPIGRLVEGMRREDPPPVAKLAVPVEVVHEAHDMSTTTNCPRTQATADLMVIAFYYLLRVGEYTKPTRVKRNGKWVRATRTVQFTVGNIGFKDIHGKDISRHSSLEKLLQAHSVTMKITNQKNGHMGTTIHHEDTGAKTSPTKALARRVHHILANGGDTDSLLCDFYDEASDTFSSVQAQHVRDMVKAMVVKLNLTEKGITPDLVGTHSLRAGGAMALKLHGYDDTTIMKMGRWTSLTFTMYIHNQIAHLSAGVSRKMGEKLPFINIAAIEK